jgi:hypothetical protein
VKKKKTLQILLQPTPNGLQPKEWKISIVSSKVKRFSVAEAFRKRNTENPQSINCPITKSH